MINMPPAGASLLDQLRPNHLPGPVGFWPPAIGWWIVTATVLLVLIVSGVALFRYWKKNRYRSVALLEAQQIQNDFTKHQSQHRFARECNELLKRVALHAFNGRDIAGLNGEQWQQFLSETGKSPDFANSNAFNNDRFNPAAVIDTDNAFELTRRWIKKHHA